jgi:hypothetical protein
MRILSTLLLVLSVGACSGTEDNGSNGTPAGSGEAAGAPNAADVASLDADVAALDADVASLAARHEHDAPQLEVQHVLISFQGAPRMTGVTRTLEEAHELAARVYARAKAGDDFVALMKEFSNDSGGGTYPMSKQSRGGMVDGFGNVGWRLEVGEIGVAPYDPDASPYGWHIIKRTK